MSFQFLDDRKEALFAKAWGKVGGDVLCFRRGRIYIVFFFLFPLLLLLLVVGKTPCQHIVHVISALWKEHQIR